MIRSVRLLLLLVFLGSNIKAQIPNGMLLASWSFSVNAKDGSGNGYDLINHNAVLTTDRFNNVGHAYLFNGDSAFFLVPDSLPLQLKNMDYTISFWVAPFATTDTTNGPVFTNSLGTNYYVFGLNQIGITTSGGRPMVQIATETTKADVDSIPLQTWTHLLFVHHNQAGTTDIYVNGVLVSTGPPSTRTRFNRVLAGLYIGYDAFSGDIFHGKIDDINIYTRELATSEISMLFHATNNDSLVSGIENIDETAFTMYPNPASSNITVENTNKQIPLVITNALGQVLIKEVLEANQKKTIDISYLPKGLYFLNNRKFIKE